MPVGSFLDWTQFILQILESHATRLIQYLPPSHYCVVDYPTRLRQHGRGSQIYPYVVTTENPGPFFVIDAVLRDFSGQIRLCGATFVVPSREPIPSIHAFYAEWLTEASVYIVRLIPSVRVSENSWTTPASLTARPFRFGTEDGDSDVDNIFDVEYFWEEIGSLRRDESQYDLGFFAVCHIDKKPVTSGNNSPPRTTIDEPESMTLLKPTKFDWSNCSDEPFQSNHSFYIPRDETNMTMDDSETLIASIIGHFDPTCSSSIQILSRARNDKSEVECTPSTKRPLCEIVNDTIDFPISHYLTHPEALKELTPVARAEKSWQERWMVKRPDIHHFNWLGQPILQRSYTTPEESLFVIITPPKPLLNSVSRIGAILRQAMRYVDPVLYDGKWDDLAKRRGHALLQTITGHAFQFYTEKGTWQQDCYEWDGNIPCCDPADPVSYLTQPWLPVNGWLETTVSPTRQQYVHESSRLLEDSVRTRRRWPGPYQRSSLRVCVTLEKK
ncbi:hypothetical protein PRK78_003163 [Emydomyces testavorans]|uniref:Uncharacterized protein n=1 Tax=Emydomyces testavorans TaxID=2070801 RepID=A0AAF0DHN8_9EURO|nr:hypothetical protein PRK78_003163 [Emydomyces testavorans]